MTEIKIYKCDFCGKEYSIQERADEMEREKLQQD